MKIQDIVLRLIEEMPRHTDVFTDTVNISSLTFSGGLVTATTASVHGLVTGRYVNIQNAYAKNPITGLTQADNVATAITQNAHDLTENYQGTVNISGANQSEYNGDKTLLSVVDRNTFTFQVAGDPTSPATGTILLGEQKSFEYNGAFEVTVIDTTTFTYEIDGTPTTPAIGSNIIAEKNVRISGGTEIEHLLESYTKQNDDNYWAFAVPEPVVANKSSRVIDDGVDISENAIDYDQTCLQNWSIYVFVPTTNNISSRDAYDSMVDIRVSLIKALSAYKFDSHFTSGEQYGLVFDGDEPFAYDKAYYIHLFKFQDRFRVNYDDVDLHEPNTAFRDFALDMYVNDTQVTDMAGKLDQ